MKLLLVMQRARSGQRRIAFSDSPVKQEREMDGGSIHQVFAVQEDRRGAPGLQKSGMVAALIPE
jgi:hypothetical protein